MKARSVVYRSEGQTLPNLRKCNRPFNAAYTHTGRIELSRPAVVCPYTWEYLPTLSCCVPKSPFVPLPICPVKHTWNSKSYVCQPATLSHPMPSSIYGRKMKYSRRTEQTRLAPCPSGLEKCPISGLASTNDDYEW